MHSPKALGIIPARGGSKRLLRKNLQLLAGYPLIYYTIQAAMHSTLLTDYLVSSEDSEILSVARQYGAPTPFVRPAELAKDNVRNIDVVLHALNFMEDKTGRHYDIIVLLQPTSPIRIPKHIDDAVKLLCESEMDSLASVKGPYKKLFPILKGIRDGVLESYCTSGDVEMNEPFYIYNASVYAVKRGYLVKERKLMSPRQVPLVMDQFKSIDIDTKDDLLMAEAALNILKEYN